MLRRPSCGGLFKTVFSVDGFLSGGCGICPSNTAHPAAAAFRTDMDINVPYRFQEFRHGKANVFFPETLVSLNGKYQFQVLAFPTVVQESIIPDFLKAMREHMHQITPDEFRVIQSDGTFWVAGLFAPGGKDSLLFINRKDSAVGNGNLVRISPKIFHGVAETVESLLYVWTPFFLVKVVAKPCPAVRVTQLFTRRRKS